MKKYTTSQRLKEIMNKKGIKQIDILNKIQPICEKWGVKMGSNDLSQYVTGKVEPSQKKLSVLAEVLDTNEVWLMGYDVPMTKNLSADDFDLNNQYTVDIMNDDVFSNYDSLTHLSVKTGIPTSEIKQLLNHEIKIPKPIHLKLLADALNQDVLQYFNGVGYIQDADSENDLYDTGIRFMLSENDKQELCSILEEIWKKDDKNITKEKIYSNLFENEKNEFSKSDLKEILKPNTIIQFDNGELIDTSSDIVMIPVLGVIKAGIAIEAQEDIIEYVDIPKSWLKGGKTYYGLLISGDSMFPKYQEKDIVIFEKTDTNDISYNKKDCAVMVNGFDATFKNVAINDDGITLIPLNPYNSDGYTNMPYTKEQVEQLPVKIVGIAREKRTRL